MSKVISVFMNKGGVGKTTLITNLASAMSLIEKDKKVLLLDTDGQGNSSISCGTNPNTLKKTIYDALLSDEDYRNVIIPVTKNLDLLPSNDEMNYLEFDVLTQQEAYSDPFSVLKKVVDQARRDYDYIFVDTPPSMGLMAGNVLSVSDDVFIPFVPESFSVQGLIKVVETIRGFKVDKGVNVEIAGVVGMMIDKRTSLHSSLMLQTEAFCLKQRVPFLKTRVPRTISFPSYITRFGLPIVLADPQHHMSKIYFDILEEVYHGQAIFS